MCYLGYHGEEKQGSQNDSRQKKSLTWQNQFIVVPTQRFVWNESEWAYLKVIMGLILISIYFSDITKDFRKGFLLNSAVIREYVP